jgi:hypothetical protein
MGSVPRDQVWPGCPVGDYVWRFDGDSLTLAPRVGSDPCGIRGFIWAETEPAEGELTRVGVAKPSGTTERYQ